MNPLTRTTALLLGLGVMHTANAADLTIRVENIHEPGGMLHWALFDSKESFDRGGAAVIASRVRVLGDSVEVTVHKLPPGRYALRSFHDSNGNGELDSNALGIPREGYGFSNDAGARGPARFDDAAVSVEGDLKLVVRLR